VCCQHRTWSASDRWCRAIDRTRAAEARATLSLDAQSSHATTDAALPPYRYVQRSAEQPIEVHASSFVLKQSWLVAACTGQPAGVSGGTLGAGASTAPELEASGAAGGAATGCCEGVALHAMASARSIHLPCETVRPQQSRRGIRSTSYVRRRLHRCVRMSLPRALLGERSSCSRRGSAPCPSAVASVVTCVPDVRCADGWKITGWH
jgi:hypothetical protein